MLLTVEVISDVTATNIDIEWMGVDFFLLNVESKIANKSPVPSYWRLLGSDSVPPLEIGFDENTGTLRSITAFISKTNIRQTCMPDLGMAVGNIRVSTDIFKCTNDFLDNDGNFMFSLCDNKLSCFLSNEETACRQVINNDVSFLLSTEDRLVGFIITLDEMQLTEIKGTFEKYGNAHTDDCEMSKD